MTLSPAGLILTANQTFLIWTGYSAADLIESMTFVSLLAPGSKLFHETHFSPLLHMEGQVNEIAMEMSRADGSRLPVLVNAVMERASDSAPGLTRVAVFDATERRRYELELHAEKQRAQESERRLAVVARTLQETLMPPRDPRIEGLDVATAYRPAGAGDEIGGDFYDMFAVSESDWVVLIGDVAGKGVEAAVVATLARHTVRALAITEPSPAEILRQLNQVLLSHPTERFCTAIILRLHRSGDRWRVTMSIGGHPPAILLGGAETPGLLGQPSQLVGAFDNASYDDLRFELRSGMTLLLHTDGITEGRRGQESYGEDRLMRLLDATPEGVVELVARILDDVLGFQNNAAHDDIAVVALHVPATRHGAAPGDPDVL